MSREFNYGDISESTVTHEGVTRTLREWSAALNVPYPTVRMRFKRGKRSFFELFNKNGISTIQVSPTKVVHQVRSFLDDLLGNEMARQVRDVAADMNTTPTEVVREMVKFGLKKLGN